MHWRHPFPVLVNTCPFTPRSLLNKQKEEVTNLGQCRKLNGIWRLPPIQHYFLLSLVSPFSALLIIVKLLYYSARTHWILLNITCYLLDLQSRLFAGNKFQEHCALQPLFPVWVGLFMYPKNQLTSRMATVVRTHWECLQVWELLFFVESTFPSNKNKERLFADNSTPHLLGVICFTASI